MSYFDDASLVMIPSGYKEDKVYSVKPIDGSGDLDFTRASSATRIGPTGLIEKTRTNLVTQSNQFDTTWTSTAATLTSGQSGYDGTNDAWKLESNATGVTRITNVVTGGTLMNFSLYAKAGNVDFLKMTVAISGTNGIITWDLTNGDKFSDNSIASNFESVGGGWYRISATFSLSSSATEVRLEARSTSGSDSTASGDFIYIQDSQVEQGLVATSYIETTTTAVTVGSYDNVPRLNYTAGSTSSCPSLLLEPQRTNLLPHSEYQDGWSVKSNISLITNSATSPEGVQNATNSYPSATGASFIYESFTYTNATTYVFSVFAKANGKDYLQIATSGASWSGNLWCTFDLNLVATDNNGFESVGIEDYGNGWYRCYIEETAVATSLSRLVIGLVSNANAGRLSSITPNGTDGVLIYGAQIEAGSYATSYIPTYGATVTRVAETVEKTGVSSLIGQTAGTMFVEFKNLDNFQAYIGVDNGSVGDRILLYGTLQNKVFVQIRKSSSTIFSGGSGVISGGAKAAVAFDASGAVFYVNGTQVASGSGTTYANNLVQFTMNHANQIGTKVNQALLFKTRLSNTQLAELTS